MADCNRLGLLDLKLLREALDLLIAKKEARELFPEDRRAQRLNTNGIGARGSNGYIEAKTIRGYGPYLYLRIRHNGVHHSFYLGKEHQS
ncbi:MAG: hypothetical protein SVX43_11700 [Cyanobacteriota bacterium]|nr:hypothetical protein [Cyanobacteriota bacterium]